MARYMCWPVAQAMGRRVAVTRQRVENQCHFGGDKELEVHQVVTNLRQGSLCSRGHQCPVMSMYFQLLRRCSWGCSPNVFLGEYRQAVLMLHGCPSDAWTWKCLARWIGLPNPYHPRNGSKFQPLGKYEWSWIIKNDIFIIHHVLIIYSII